MFNVYNNIMEIKNKIYIKKMSNQNDYNELDIEKSEIFLKKLQKFIVDIGLAKVIQGEYEFDDKSYDMNTYHTLFYEDPKDGFLLKKLAINDFGEGEIVRYFKEIEMLIIFLKDKIKLIFYCDMKNRENIIKSLLKFCKVMKVNS